MIGVGKARRGKRGNVAQNGCFGDPNTVKVPGLVSNLSAPAPWGEVRPAFASSEVANPRPRFTIVGSYLANRERPSSYVEFFPHRRPRPGRAHDRRRPAGAGPARSKTLG